MSIPWFTTLFERGPDAQPMKGLAEWHHGLEAGVQLFESKKNAGCCTLTLIIESIYDQHERLSRAGLRPGVVERADYTSISRLHDPDGNLIVLAQPSKS